MAGLPQTSQRIDAAKYLVLQIHGGKDKKLKNEETACQEQPPQRALLLPGIPQTGLYLDTDVECLRELSDTMSGFDMVVQARNQVLAKLHRASCAPSTFAACCTALIRRKTTAAQQSTAELLRVGPITRLGRRPSGSWRSAKVRL